VSLERAIAAGMVVLDEKVPGWVDQIDLDTLDMASATYVKGGSMCGCILAQVDTIDHTYGDYFRARRRLSGLTDDEDELDWGFDHAFNVSAARYDELTEAWRTAIRARREVVAS
jgi:hypothetical protein